jgi:hypothetical protein
LTKRFEPRWGADICLMPHNTGSDKDVSAEHAILRLLPSKRTRDRPVALLDIEGAYPSMPRQMLVTLVRDNVDPLLADMLMVLLAPTRVLTVGDPAATVMET